MLATERTVYASDGQYFLSRLIEDDRENYVELHRQINGEKTLFLNPACKDIMWESVLNGKAEVYSIFEISGAYCGNIEVQNPSCDCPEIGIELLTGCRNKGIAPRAVRLMAKEFYNRHTNLKYFLIRISSGNAHSKHVFEKMGAVFFGEEEGEFKRFERAFIEAVGEKEYGEVREKIKNQFGEAEDEVIYRYKYAPEVFMKEEF